MAGRQACPHSDGAIPRRPHSHGLGHRPRAHKTQGHIPQHRLLRFTFHVPCSTFYVRSAVSPCLPVAVSPCRRVAASPRRRVAFTLRSDLPCALNDPLVRCQLTQAHGPPGVHLVGRNPDLRRGPVAASRRGAPALGRAASSRLGAHLGLADVRRGGTERTTDIRLRLAVGRSGKNLSRDNYLLLAFSFTNSAISAWSTASERG